MIPPIIPHGQAAAIRRAKLSSDAHAICDSITAAAGGGFAAGTPSQSTDIIGTYSQIVPVPSTAAVLTSMEIIGARATITNETGVALFAEFGNADAPSTADASLGAVCIPAGMTFHAEFGGRFFSVARLTAQAAPTAVGSRAIINLSNAHSTV